MGGQMSETVVQDTSFASESQAPRRDIVGEAMRAGAAVAEKLGHAAAIATVRGCLDAAPLGPTTLQFHDDVRQPTGRWAQMSMADLGAWFVEHGRRIEPQKSRQPALCVDCGEGQRKGLTDVRARRLLFLDRDGGDGAQLDDVLPVLRELGIAFACHDSYGSTADAPRFHVVIGLSRWLVFDRALRSPTVIRTEQSFIAGFLCALLGFRCDSSHATAGRLVFAGCRPSEAHNPRRGFGADGFGLDHDRLLAALDWLTVRASLVDATHSPEGQVSGEVPATGSIAEAHAAAIAALPPSLGSSVYRATRFLRYLEKSEPCRADGRAGGHCLMLARIGLEGFLLSPDDVVAAMLSSEWNRRCVDAKGAPYPWQRHELRHKVKSALAVSTPARFGHMLLVKVLAHTTKGGR